MVVVNISQTKAKEAEVMFNRLAVALATLVFLVGLSSANAQNVASATSKEQQMLLNLGSCTGSFYRKDIPGNDDSSGAMRLTFSGANLLSIKLDFQMGRAAYSNPGNPNIAFNMTGGVAKEIKLDGHVLTFKTERATYALVVAGGTEPKVYGEYSLKGYKYALSDCKKR